VGFLATAFATQRLGMEQNETAQRGGCECDLGPKTLTKWDVVALA
jgi:hypothetical protein